MTERLRGGLVWRLYAIALVQFSLVVACALGIGYVLTRQPGRWDMQSLSTRLKPVAHDRAALARELQELRANEKLMVSIYDDDSRLLVSNVVPALRAPHFGDAGKPTRSDPQGGPPPGGPPPLFSAPPPHFGGRRNGPPSPETFGRFELDGRECWLIARFEHQRPGRWPLFATLAAGVLVFGAGAVLTARWIARPLSRLSRMAISLGQGDLGARSELSRSDEVGDVARAFDEMAERLQRLLKTEKELLANVAHELRTPLARIRVALEIASEGDAAAARASLAEIGVDLSELEALINDVLAAARFELAEGVSASAGFNLHLQALEPADIAKRAAELFRGRHPERPFELAPSDATSLIEADPVLLRRVLDNLLENAHKYSPEPGTRITLALDQRGAEILFTVSDAGMGIPGEDLPRVFGAFFRGERSRSRGTGGVGLGLTLAKRIVEAHGGTVEVESAVGQGSTFRVRLPVRSSALPASA